MRMRYLVHETRKNRVVSLLILLQTAMVFLVMIGVISAIVSRYEKYAPIRKYLEQDGVIMNLNSIGGRNGVHTWPMAKSEEVEKSLKQAKVSGLYRLDMYFEGLPQYSYPDIIQEITMTLGYDNDLLSCYSPVMKSGRWLRTEDADTDEIEVVLALHKGGKQYRVGDQILLKKSSLVKTEDEILSVPVPARVVGILGDRADYLGFNPKEYREEDGLDFRTCYTTYDSKTEKESMAFVSIEDVCHNSEVYRAREKNLSENSVWVYIVENLCFVTYDKGISNDNRKYNEDFLKYNGDFAMSRDLRTVRKNSMDYIYDQMDILLPILIGLIVLTLMSTVSNTAISMKQSMREYAVYYINGLTWYQCVWIHMKSVIMTQIATLLVTLGGLEICQRLNLLDQTVLTVSVWQVAGCVAVILLFLLSSLVVAVTLIGRNSAKDVLREAD